MVAGIVFLVIDNLFAGSGEEAQFASLKRLDNGFYCEFVFARGDAQQDGVLGLCLFKIRTAFYHIRVNLNIFAGSGDKRAKKMFGCFGYGTKRQQGAQYPPDVFRWVDNAEGGVAFFHDARRVQFVVRVELDVG